MIIPIIVGICVVASIIIIKHYKKKMLGIEEELKETKSSLRSAFVKFGKSFEHFVPFTKDFPGDKNKTSFLGMPIDFICFDEDAVKFIEVKTGKSQLNKNQKRVKELIENNKVEWHEVRC